MKDIDNKTTPFFVLVANSKPFASFLKRYRYLTTDIVKRTSISLVSHASRVQKDVFFVGKILNKELKEFVKTFVFGFEEISGDEKANYLLNDRMHDAVPAVLSKTTLPK